MSDWLQSMNLEAELHKLLASDKKRRDFGHAKKVALARGYQWNEAFRRALSNVVGQFESEYGLKLMTADSKKFQKNEKVKVATKTMKLPPKTIQRQDSWNQASYVWVPYDSHGHSMTTKIGSGTFRNQKECEQAARNMANRRDPSFKPASHYIPHQVGVYSGMGDSMVLLTVFRKGEMILPT